MNLANLFRTFDLYMIKDVHFVMIVDGSLYDDHYGYRLHLRSYPKQLNNSLILRFNYFNKYYFQISCVYLDNLVYQIVSYVDYSYHLVELNNDELIRTICDELNKYLCDV